MRQALRMCFDTSSAGKLLTGWCQTAGRDFQYGLLTCTAAEISWIHMRACNMPDVVLSHLSTRYTPFPPSVWRCLRFHETNISNYNGWSSIVLFLVWPVYVCLWTFKFRPWMPENEIKIYQITVMWETMRDVPCGKLIFLEMCFFFFVLS